MPIGVKYSGVWQSPIAVGVKYSGLWRQVQAVFVKEAGLWKQAWAAPGPAPAPGPSPSPPPPPPPAPPPSPSNVVLTDSVVTDSQAYPAFSTASFRFNTDGTISQLFNGSYVSAGTWYNGAPIAGVGNSYWITAHVNSGEVPVGAALDISIQMNVAREWKIGPQRVGAKTSQLLISIAGSAAGTVIDSGIFTIESESL